MKISRSELYERVWSEPMVNIAKEFGVSSSYLTRVCRRLNVPHPARGYWEKIAAGRVVSKVVLPPGRAGDEISWTPGGGSADIQRRAEISLDPAVVPKPTKLRPLWSEQHDLVANMKSTFLAGTFSKEGNYLKPSKRNLIDLVVTTATLDAALALANALLLVFERMGHRVVLASRNDAGTRAQVDTKDVPTKQTLYNNLWSPGRNTVLYANGTPIGLTIFEITEATPMRYSGNGKYIKESEFVAPKGRNSDQLHWRSIHDIPSGRLCVQIYTSCYDVTWSRQWKECRTGEFIKKSTSLANEILACEAEAADAILKGKRSADAEQVRWEEMRAKWTTEALESKRVKALQRSREELEGLMDRFEKWERLDRFLAIVTNAVDDRSDADRARLVTLMEAARTIIGSRPTLNDFLSWKAPHEQD